MSKRLSRLAAALSLLLLPAVAAGCGGPAEEGGRRLRRRQRGQDLARRLLDAEGGLRGADPGLPEDRPPARACRSRSPTARPATSRARWPAACPPTSSRSRWRPTSTSSSSPGSSTPTGPSTPTDGFVTNSVVVLAVRKGNPKGIKTWDDIVKQGVEVITPNPFTSGGAKWNLMAAYGSQIEQGKSPEEATAVPARGARRTRAVQDKSAREALQTFAGGKGDVLISYENEAITAQKAGIDLDYVIPDQTILIQNPAAVTNESKNPDKAKAFLDWLVTPEAQKIYASKGYRSVLPDLVDKSTYPTPKKLFKIDEFGGWSKVNDEFFDPEKRLRRRDRAGPGGLHCRLTPPSRPARRPAPRRAARRASGAPLVAGRPLGRLAHADRPDPARGRRRALARRRPGGVLGRHHERRRRSPRSSLTLVVSLIVAAIDAVMGTLIAWVLVRDEFPGKRFVNALIDLPFALPTIVAGLVLLALYGPSGPVGINIAYTRVAVAAGAAVRHAAVRRARRAAGADGARARGRGGRRVARRQAVDDLPPDHPAGAAAGDAGRRRARVRARGRRVRLDRADQRQPAVQDRGRVGARLRPDRERQHDRRRRGVGAAAGDLVRGAAGHLVRRAQGDPCDEPDRRCARIALGYLARAARRPGRDGLLPRVRERLRRRLGRRDHAAGPARVLPDRA